MALSFGLDGFKSAAERLRGEEEDRRRLVSRSLKFGVRFLDDALAGILPHDLILVGAYTGAGKTALVSLIAQENVRAGKRVHYFALEAEPNEIERRLKYRALVDRFYADHRVTPDEKDRLNYRDWYWGRLDDVLGRYESDVEDWGATESATLSTYYRGTSFTGDELERLFRAIQDQTDLVILDHLHYVDTDGEDHVYDEACHACMARPLSTMNQPVIEVGIRRPPKHGGEVAALELQKIRQELEMQDKGGDMPW